MLKRFAKILMKQPEAIEEPGPGRIRLATCVVLLEAARADNEFTDAERTHIVEVMQTRFELNNEEAHDLIEEATQLRDDSSDLWRFTHEINKAYPLAEKIAILEESWRIFYSDGTLDGHEDHLAHKLRNLLNLNHPQMIKAKMKVLKEIRGE